ncbi:MAG: hypothetical protein LUD19_00015 [Clostridia bacterium]|nr:hypothetical protein [Clostridia bacterium]
MTVEYGSALYFIYPLSEILIVIGLYFLLRNRSKRVIYWVLFAMFAFNFALHFLKVLFYPYNDPTVYSKNDIVFTLSPSNICALNVIIFPFLYLTKRPALKDYMFYVGIISGFAAVWLPSMGDFDTSNGIAFDTFRFYICHGILWMAPLLMVLLGVHKLNYRRIWVTPLLYIIVITAVLAINYAIYYIGYTKSISDNGFTIKPPDSLAQTGIGKFVLAFVPSVFKPSEDNSHYWPVAWQIFPVYIIGCPLAFVMSLWWEGKHFISDLKAIGAGICLEYRALRIAKKRSRYHKKYGNKVNFKLKCKRLCLRCKRFLRYKY